MDTCGSMDFTETSYVDVNLNHLDQEDPVLIEAIRKMLIKPSDVRQKLGLLFVLICQALILVASRIRSIIIG